MKVQKENCGGRQFHFTARRIEVKAVTPILIWPEFQLLSIDYVVIMTIFNVYTRFRENIVCPVPVRPP